MKLLYLSPFPARPLYGGAVVRNHHLGQALSKRHQVWASFCGIDGNPAWAGEVPLSGTGRRALFDPSFMRRAYLAIRANGIEAIVASSLIAGLHGALLKRITRLPFWMDEHNVEWHCSRRYGFKGWPLVYMLEGFILRSADYVTCVSEDDRKRLIANFRLPPDRVNVAPNGVSFADLRAKEALASGSRPARGRRRALFFGVLNYPPNRDAVRFLSQEIAPRAPADLDILIAGFGGEDLAERYPNLTHLGFAEDIHAVVRSCDGVIVPIMAGGGTRMKILEAVACGRPVVSTTCGAEGLDRDALGPALTVTDSVPEMLRWLDQLTIGRQAKVGPKFEDSYDWERIWHRMSPL